MHVIWRPHAFKSFVNQFDDYLELFHRFLQKTNTALSLLPVYYAGEQFNQKKTSEDLGKELIKLGHSINLFSTYDDLHSYLMKNSSADGLLLGMGARDPQLPVFLRSLTSC